MVECWLPYGKTNVHVSVPIKNLASLSEMTSSPSNDPEISVKQCLESPLGGRRLRDIATRGNTAAIAVGGDFPSNSLPLVLSGLLSELREAGLSNNGIVIVTSAGTTGTLLPETERQLVQLRKEGINVLHHQWSDTRLRAVESERGGEVLALREEFLSADLKIVVGEVKPDPFFKFTGSTTVLFPGLSGRKSIGSFFTPLLKQHKEGAVQSRELIWKEVCGSTSGIGIDFAVDVVSDTQGRLVGAFSGDRDQVSTAACQLCGDIYGDVEKTRADIAIVGVGGYPYDRSLYRTAYSIASLGRDLGRGESVILVAECPEGCGDVGFSEFMKTGYDAQAVASKNRESWTIEGETARSFREILEARSVILVSMLPEYLLKPLGLRCFRAVNDALATLNKSLRSDYKVSVFTHGSFVSARKESRQ